MQEYGYLVSVAIIMLSTKILGDLTKKVSMPQVVGALLAGVIVGPSCLGLIAESQFITLHGGNRRHPADVQRRAGYGHKRDQKEQPGLHRDRPGGRALSAAGRHRLLLFLLRGGKHFVYGPFCGRSSSAWC